MTIETIEEKSTLSQPQTVGSISAPAQEVEGENTTKLAKLVSLVLHPFLIAPLSIILILWLDRGNIWEALGWAAFCAVFVVGPAGLYLRDKVKKRQFSDADVSVREQRYGFYIFGGVCMILCFVALLWLKAPAVLIAGFLSALAAWLAGVVINRYWTKASIHTAAVAGVAVAAAFYAWPLAVVLALATGLVIWSRLVTKRHTLDQALVAVVVAAGCVVLVFGPLMNVL
jgi:hypothetical protein